MTNPVTTTLRENPSPSMRTARWLLGRFGRISCWFAPILLAGELIAFVLIRAFGGAMTTSLWEGIADVAPYIFLFALVTYLSYTYLPLHVAHGGTRRSFVAAGAATVVCASVVLAALVQLGYLLESFVYARYGWTQALELDHVFRHPHDVGPLLFEYTLACIFVGTLGLLVAGIYYRFGSFWATALLVATLLVGGTVQRLLVDPWLDTSALPLSTRLILWLVFVVLGLLMTYLALRRAPIRSRSV